MYSLVIRNGTIIDGLGNPGFVGDLAIEGNKIAAIQKHISGKSKREVDAQGLIVAPGFVDIQNHSDGYWQLFDNPTLDSLVTQGFTTIVVGNCGGSLAPLLSPSALLAVQKWHSISGNNINWVSFADYANHMSKSTYGCNIASLVGYSTLRRGLVGDDTRSIDTNETEALKQALAESLSAGAFGLSSGLSYAHEITVTELELYELAKVVQNYNALLSVHLRSENSEIVASLEEAIDLAAHSGVKLKISHLKIRGKRNWHYFADCVEKIETAYHRGLRVWFDTYPYNSIWHPLYTYLPKWAIEGGRKNLLNQLKDKAQRNKIIAYLQNSDSNLSGLIIASTSTPLHAEGKTVGSIAKAMETTSEEAVLEILEKGGSEVLVFDELLDYEQIKKLYQHPLALVATDGAGFSENSGKQYGLVHPRSFGTSTKFLKEIIAEKSLSVEQAVQKLTLLPATLIGLQGRGSLKTGNFADITIFNPSSITDKSTLQNPFRYSQGIEEVLVNGVATVQKGKPTENKGGLFLKKTT